MRALLCLAHASSSSTPNASRNLSPNNFTKCSLNRVDSPNAPRDTYLKSPETFKTS